MIVLRFLLALVVLPIAMTGWVVCVVLAWLAERLARLCALAALFVEDTTEVRN